MVAVERSQRSTAEGSGLECEAEEESVETEEETPPTTPQKLPSTPHKILYVFQGGKGPQSVHAYMSQITRWLSWNVD
jgi:hypothetical protein